MEKLCGCNESCFKVGKMWGHFEGVMCHFLEEIFDVNNGECKSFCEKTGEKVKVYTTKEQYKEVKSEI